LVTLPLELGSRANWSEANREKIIYLVAHPRQYLPLEQAAECKLNESKEMEAEDHVGKCILNL
jgi:hypothetical protein